ncbi:MAG: DUF2461 domain-containing protein [Provencibacterium sp.]|jgi:uncharacterized protein (DUF2461 family)|nr:DUF2461 domain-containing protein [Provencibacterium sp.]
MFQGFNESTIKYYEAIRRENSKKAYQDNEQLYLEGVKIPLDELYFEWYNYFNAVDRELLSNKRRGISSVYNDARFCCGSPIKEYFYIRFKLNKTNKKNALGFFFDASLDGYKYGLNIYHPDANGMNKIRDYLLDNKRFAKRAIETFNQSGLLEIQGEKYKRAYYPNEDIVLQDWLERKRISFTHEESLSAAFYKREILDGIFSAFDSVNEVYFMLKEAL